LRQNKLAFGRRSHKRRSILELTPTFRVFTFDMVRHTRTQPEEMAFRAQKLVAEGQERIVAQQARVAALNRKGGSAHESKQFLEIMEVTQSLQIGHLDLLRRELHDFDGAS
jgi:hypothetical protein